MANFCKENRCLICPKVFCCPSCRGKHESFVHKIELRDFYNTKTNRMTTKKQDLPITQRPQINPALSDIVETALKQDRVNEPPHKENGQVKKLIALFDKAICTPHQNSDTKAKDKAMKNLIHHENSRQLLVTSTPHQTACEKEPINFDETSDEHDVVPELRLSSELPVINLIDSTENSNSETDMEVEHINKKAESFKTPKHVTFNEETSFMVTLSSCHGDENSKSLSDLTLEGTIDEDIRDKSGSTKDETSSLSSNISMSLRTNENIVKEYPESEDSLSPQQVEATLWQSAYSYSNETENFDAENEKNHELDTTNQHEDSTKNSFVFLNEMKFKSDYAKSLQAAAEARELSLMDQDFKFLPSSTANLSHSVWQSITNSVKCALNSTREICSFSGSMSKRSLDTEEDSEPIAKRRKYEPVVKCRPPIHEMGAIVYFRLQKKTVLRFDKATQTDESSFR